MDDPFDFSRVFTDVVVRTAEVDGPRWVDVLHTGAGRRAPWNWWPGFESFEEAMTWLAKTIA